MDSLRDVLSVYEFPFASSNVLDSFVMSKSDAYLPTFAADADVREMFLAGVRCAHRTAISSRARSLVLFPTHVHVLTSAERDSLAISRDT